jgi:hypothetical protein
MSKRRGGLGRGLGTFIPTEVATATGGQEVDIDAVGPNPHQPRQLIDETRSPTGSSPGSAAGARRGRPGSPAWPSS